MRQRDYWPDHRAIRGGAPHFHARCCWGDVPAGALADQDGIVRDLDQAAIEYRLTFEK